MREGVERGIECEAAGRVEGEDGRKGIFLYRTQLK